LRPAGWNDLKPSPPTFTAESSIRCSPISAAYAVDQSFRFPFRNASVDSPFPDVRRSQGGLDFLYNPPNPETDYFSLQVVSAFPTVDPSMFQRPVSQNLRDCRAKTLPYLIFPARQRLYFTVSLLASSLLFPAPSRLVVSPHSFQLNRLPPHAA